MSCASGCVCDVLARIMAEQEAAAIDCRNDCFNLNPATNNNNDTMPFILWTKKNTLFYAFSDIASNDCFATVYFRVSEFDKQKKCVTLELLQPNDDRSIDVGYDCCVPLNQVCQSGELELVRTGQCVIVDCECLCAIECINPNAVVSNFSNNNKICNKKPNYGSKE
ncbi:CotY/CotZ family spore coat protein [Salsuginibacillus halophilus]|uniref:CotY/CotZ family spore coat protein n=1 Tax=Salsuginibacillus halophilus TaxID=517424 RepID=UPI0015E6C274|nr:CotY/CotZ family spore coat protein [Salsuginibacillus halophilus]